MLNPDGLINEVTPRSRKWIGIICLSIALFLAIATYLSQDIIIFAIVLVVGLPLFLVGISLLFGNAKNGKGIFSPVTLNFIGILIGLGSIAGAFAGEPNTAIGIVISLGCFMLARKRRKDKTQET
ncbi:MAG: hypothetical protein ABIL58_10465 [Pseudomonadota bacterium]